MLRFADNLSLPIEAVTQKFAFLGRTGSGKTYGAMKLAELFLDAQAQIIVLDGIGVWYGLRLGADGKSKGYSIPVFGGEQGDVPLESQAGKLLGKLIVEEGFSAILDVSNFRKHERKTFATDFVEELFHRKKTNRSAAHFFCEESQMFIPERVGKDTARMVGAFEDLFKLGRNYGIGGSLISQRPQAVNKEVLNQTEILLAFQMTGPHERKAIKGWVADKGMDVDLADELPSLSVGDAYLWSPQFLRTVKKIRIAKKKTYDASSTPEVGAVIVAPRELSPVDVEKIKSSMADIVKRAEAIDPKKLQTRIRHLEAELAKKPVTVVTEPKEVVKEVPIVPAKEIEALTSGIKAFRTEYIGQLERISKGFEALNGQSSINKIEQAVNRIMFAILNKKPLAPSRPMISTRPAPTEEPASFGDLQLNKTQQRILDALAWYEFIGNTSPSLPQIGAVALIDPTGGHFSNTVGPLSSHGLVERGQGLLKLTDAGRSLAQPLQDVDSLDGYHNVLRSRIRKMKSASNRTIEMLNIIIAAGGVSLTTEQIGERLGIDHTGGHFSNTIGPLGTAGLITRQTGCVIPTDVLFPEGLN